MWQLNATMVRTESGQVALPIEWDSYISVILSVIAAALLHALQILRRLITAHTGNLMYSSLELSHLRHVMRMPTVKTSATMVMVLAFLAVRLAIAPAVRATFELAVVKVHTSSHQGLLSPSGNVVRLNEIRTYLEGFNNMANGTNVTASVPRGYRVVANLTRTDVSGDTGSAYFGNQKYGNFTIFRRSNNQYFLGAWGPVLDVEDRQGCQGKDYVLTGSGTFVRPTPENYTLVVHFMSAEISCYRQDKLLMPNGTKPSNVCPETDNRSVYGFNLNGTTIFSLQYARQGGEDNIDVLLLRVEVVVGTPAWYRPLACGVDESLSWAAGMHPPQPALQNSSVGFSALMYYDAAARGYSDYQDPASTLMPHSYLDPNRTGTVSTVTGNRDADTGAGMTGSGTGSNGAGDNAVLQFMLSAMLDDAATLEVHAWRTYWLLTPATYALLLLSVLPIPVLLALEKFGREVVLHEDLYSLAVSSTQQSGLRSCKSVCGGGSVRLRPSPLDALYVHVAPETMRLQFTAASTGAYTRYVRQSLCVPNAGPGQEAGGNAEEGLPKYDNYRENLQSYREI